MVLGHAGASVVRSLVRRFLPHLAGHGTVAGQRCADRFLALTVGRQDARKGFSLVVAAFARLLAEMPELILWVVGPIADELRPAFARLQQRFGADRVRHEDRFVPEGDLPAIFAAADVVLLAYSRVFTASSGVLSRAAATGVPVLACNHGLVGYRVQQWGLGKTFAAESVDAFCESFRTLRVTAPQLERSGMAQFAAASHLSTFSANLQQAVLEDAKR